MEDTDDFRAGNVFYQKHAREDGYEEGYRVAVAEREEAVKEAINEALQEKEQAVNEEKLENARKMKTKNIPDDVIAECTGLSLEQVRKL